MVPPVPEGSVQQSSATGSVESAIAFKSMRGTSDFRQMAALYCIDDAFIAAVDRLSRKDEVQGPGMPDKWIDYILTTGANWRSPIGRFRLVVDKLNPRALISFCGEGVRRIGPTQFEIRRRNWRPARDLHILIATPNDTNQ